jgi:hypothetical protein
LALLKIEQCHQAMRWFRAHSKLSSYGALFALAVQLVLTFGHVHLNAPAGYAAATSEASTGTPASPATHKSDIADEYCALCALVQLAGALLLSGTAALPLPFVVVQVQVGAAPQSVAANPAAAAFSARAPPLG